MLILLAGCGGQDLSKKAAEDAAKKKAEEDKAKAAAQPIPEKPGDKPLTGLPEPEKPGDKPIPGLPEVPPIGEAGPVQVPAGQQQQGLTSTISPARDLTGNWQGSMTFTNNCPNPACRYKGRMVPPSITMNLQQNGNVVIGAATMDTRNFTVEELVPGMQCATFLAALGVATSNINNGVISSSRFTFTDDGGNFWSLNLTTDLLQGTISNNDPGCMGLSSNNVSLSRQR